MQLAKMGINVLRILQEIMEVLSFPFQLHGIFATKSFTDSNAIHQ